MALIAACALGLLLATNGYSEEPDRNSAVCVRGVKVTVTEGIRTRTGRTASPLPSLAGPRFVLSAVALAGRSKGAIDIFEAVPADIASTRIADDPGESDHGILPGFGGAPGLRAVDFERFLHKVLADLALTEPTRVRHSSLDLPVGRFASATCTARGPGGDRIRIRLHVMKRTRDRYLLILCRTPENGRNARRLEGKIEKVLRSLRLLEMI
ncbi:MAG: hypothetical protein HYY18_19830 [Planctomycetes bacterium]|nr:hypothetical protein [Planctomycetota bacterium]